jgi:hypothetical protein
MRFDVLIPIFAEGEELEFNDRLAQDLKARGQDVAFLVTTPRVGARLRETHRDVFFVYEGLDRSASPPSSTIWELERRYALGSLRGFLFPQSVYEWSQKIDYLVRNAVHVFGYMERWSRDHEARFIVNHLGGEVVRRAASRVVTANGGRNAIFDFSVFPGRLVLAETEYGLRLGPLPEKRAISSSEWQVASEFLTKATRERKPYCPVSTLGFGARNFRGAIAAIRRRSDQREVSISKLATERLRKVARRVASGRMVQRVQPDEKFIFFPLHLPNDSAITLRAPQFVRQEELIAYVAERALPWGVKLYVKPHLGGRDSFPLGMLARIRRTPNVRLIEPTINSHDLIPKAMATLVINSTVGFEAILHRRPTVVVGSPFYAGHGLTVDVQDLGSLPDAIERSFGFEPSAEDVVRFLALYRRHTYEGVYGDVDGANVRRVADALDSLVRPKDLILPTELRGEG